MIYIINFCYNFKNIKAKDLTDLYYLELFMIAMEWKIPIRISERKKMFSSEKNIVTLTNVSLLPPTTTSQTSICGGILIDYNVFKRLKDIHYYCYYYYVPITINITIFTSSVHHFKRH